MFSRTQALQELLEVPASPEQCILGWAEPLDSRHFCGLSFCLSKMHCAEVRVATGCTSQGQGDVQSSMCSQAADAAGSWSWLVAQKKT